MSICTKTGDAGTTGLMYNRRVSKTDARIEACGAVDELNAALGLARAALGSSPASEKILHIQKELVGLMGEIATAPEDAERYAKDGYQLLAAESALVVEKWIHELEAQKISFAGWATPGANSKSAALDFSRTVARRAERRAQELLEGGILKNRQIQVYLNRVSDLLWLLARQAETI